MRNVGIDIGGTKIAGAVVDPDGTLLDRRQVDTPREVDALVDAVIDMGRALSDAHDVHAIGVAAAAFIDRDRERVISAPNIAWRDEPLRARLQAGLRHPVSIENDANAAGWGEYRFGAGAGTAHMLMLTMGTGIGGAVVVDGLLHRGGHGVGGELGHMRHIPGGRACGCGGAGCLEMYASGRALQAEARDIAADSAGIGAALSAARLPDGTVPGSAIARLVASGDPGATEAVRRVATALGEACASFQAILDPEIVVVGGGVAHLGDAVLDPVRAAYEASLPGFGGRPSARFALASLGNDAGIIGVADLAGSER